jgi:hypothetical protein
MSRGFSFGESRTLECPLLALSGHALASPRYVRPRLLAGGQVGFYWIVPTYFRRLDCSIPNEPLGTDYAVACGGDGSGGRAANLNALFDEWDSVRRGQPVTGERAPIYGTVNWLFREYKQSKAYTEKVSARSRPDYERTMLLVSDLVTKKGDRLGQRKMILREVRDGVTKPYSFSGMQKIVHTMRDKIGLPSTFTLDACRHGGMTELEEAALTDGQGRALSAHKSQQAYEGYAKRTMERALSATRKRHAHRLANAAGTEFRNEARNEFRNEDSKRDETSIKAMKGQ